MDCFASLAWERFPRGLGAVASMEDEVAPDAPDVSSETLIKEAQSHCYLHDTDQPVLPLRDPKKTDCSDAGGPSLPVAFFADFHVLSHQHLTKDTHAFCQRLTNA